MQTPACPALRPPALASATYWRATILGAARRTVRGTPDSPYIAAEQGHALSLLNQA